MEALDRNSECDDEDNDDDDDSHDDGRPHDEDFTANILCSTNRRALSLHIGAVLYYMSTDAIHYNIIYAALPLTELPVTVAGSTMVKARFDRLIASEYEHEYELRIWSEELT